MSMHYPVLLDLKGKKCLVIGGGKVAERKVRALIDARAKVTLVSPKITYALSQMADMKKIYYIKDHFKEKHLEETFLAIGATNKPKINHRIFQAAAKVNTLVNIVDSPEECNFIVPSTVSQGDLQISISTGGKSPALAKKIREQLEIQYGRSYRDFLLLMGELRSKVLSHFSDTDYRNKIFQALVDSELLDLFKKGLNQKAEKKAEEIINSFCNQTNQNN